MNEIQQEVNKVFSQVRRFIVYKVVSRAS